MASWLQRQRKDELKELAEEAGFKRAGSMNKTDLVPALDAFFRENETTLSAKPKFKDYFASAGRSASPIKKEHKDATAAASPSAAASSPTAAPTVASVTAAVDDASKSVAKVKRRVTKAAEELVASAQASSPGGSDPTAPASSTRSHTTPRASSSRPRASLGNTPRAAVQAAERRVSNFYSKYLEDHVDNVQETLSTVLAIQLAAIAVEGLGLLSIVLPTGLNFSFTSFGLKTYSEAAPPDLNKLLSTAFWAPVGLWFLTSIVLPSIVGFVFNLTQASGVSRRHQYIVDPVAYGVAKALIAFLVYDAGSLPLIGNIENATVHAVRHAGFGLRGLYTSSAVGALAGLYAAILRK